MLWVATSLGIYKSIDAGLNWTVVQSGNFKQGRIRLQPGNPSTVYAVSNTKFYRSVNSGDTFTQIGLGVPIVSARLLLEVTPADPQVIYILSTRTTSNAFQGVYKSTNGGTSFLRVTQTTAFDPFDNVSQTWYDLAFTISPTNANELYFGCLNIWKSTDGGLTGTQLNSWGEWTPNFTHADIHYLRFFGSKLYCGSDGGIYISSDNGVSFTDIVSNAQISQIYKLAVAKQTASKIVGGLQDNGGYSFNNGVWESYHGGDGMDCAIDPTNSNLIYGAIYFAKMLFVSSDGGQTLSNSIAAPTNEINTATGDTGGNWVTPITMNNDGELYGGFSRLHKIVNGAWVQQSSGTIGSGDLEVVSIDPSNVNNIYVSNGIELYKSSDKGINFSLIFTTTATITSVCVNYSNSNLVYLTTTAEVFKSIDGGTTFNSFNTGMPNIPKLVIVHQGRNINNPLYVGTSLGVYYRDDTMSQWNPFDTGLPNTEVRDLKINLEDNKIIAATYGRGFWQSDIPVILPLVDIKLVDILEPIPVTIDCNHIITPNISVKNVGLNTLTTISFSYAINAVPYTYNWNGSIASSQTISISLPPVTLVKGAYNINVNSTTPNDAFLDNNNGSKKFYINDLTVANITNTFENASDELLKYNENSINSLWTRGTRTGTSLTSSTNVYATSLTGNYPDKTKSYLVSGCYNLSNVTSATLSFKMAFDLELNWDIVYVEYTTNGGVSWNLLGVQGAGWYNSNRTNASSGVANDCQNCPGAQWTGTASTMTTYTQSLAAINSQTNVVFRIVFQSDDSINQEGVIIDDFLVSGTLGVDSFENNRIAISPNPSTGLYNININNFSGKLNIQVSDINGRLIYNDKNYDFNSQKTIDLSAFQSGIYILKLNSEDINYSTKLIKN